MSTINNSINANTTSPLPIIDGGTGVNAVTTAPTASAFAGWDANMNLTSNNLIESYTTTATAAGTTTLTVGSTYQQFFTGSTTQTVTLPVTSTLVLGQSFLIVNNSSGIVTVQSSGGNTVAAMAGGTQAVITCILTSGTSAASWNSDYSLNTVGVASITGTANQVIASASTGAVTLSLPQSIATGSTVQFGGLTFGGSTLSTYTANTAWTPVFTFATPGNISVVYTSQVGFYTRIGNIVTANFALHFTPTFTTSSGNVQISGLPFASDSTTGNIVVGTVSLFGTGIAWPASAGGTATHPILLLNPSSSAINIYGCLSANSGAFFTNTAFTSATAMFIYGSITYSV